MSRRVRDSTIRSTKPRAFAPPGRGPPRRRHSPDGAAAVDTNARYAPRHSR
ncbi:hypothetical protein C7S16_5056 [Burkholderia thailandensis]|uniref:Uncharacterized protein n=1 Tax=Burkholderia thailandensis TaxID=57975 RepID=A0AAW9CRK5_BURTH|nr:hypothetical protein [Burkholderia thailandensis]